MSAKLVGNFLGRSTSKTSRILLGNFANKSTNVHILRSNNACVPNEFARCLGGGRFQYRVNDIVEEWTKVFKDSDVQDPRPSIEHIVAHALHSRRVSDVYRYKNKLLSAEQFDNILKMCRMRLNKMPVQYILGEWEFRNLTLKMEPPVFIPRPESEMLVELVSEHVQDKMKILELGCGSGAISLALLSSHPNLRITAVDKSEKACDLTKHNAKTHDLQGRIEIIQKEIGEDNVQNFLDEKFDIIISNPPYVPTDQMNDIQPEIMLYEDLDALDGGKDGLNLIKLVLRISSQLLHDNGKLFLEVDTTHPEMVRLWLQQNDHLGLSLHKTHKDFFKLDRFLEIIKDA